MSRVLVDSGSEYLGSVPIGWEVSKFGRHMTLNGGQVDPRAEPWAEMVLVAPNHIESGTGRVIDLETASDQGADSGKYLAKQGQILYSKIRPALNKVAIAKEDCLCSADMYAMSSRHREDDTRYLAYLMLSGPFHAYMTQLSMRVKMPKANREELSSAPWLRPPADEQCAIADYLDRETAQIDSLVAKQKEFIGLLRERRNAVRDNALQVGLAVEREAQSTGNRWIPTLPPEWYVVPTRRLLAQGPTNGVSPEVSQMGDLRTLSVGAVRDGRVQLLDEVAKYVDRDDIKDVGRFRLHSGDVLIVRGNGNLNLVGRAGLVGAIYDDHEVIYPDLLIRIRTTREMLPEFFVAAFESPASRAQVELRARTTVGTFKISAADVRSIYLPAPPVSEQTEIVEHISVQTARIDALIAKAEELIALAKERRSALITAAVTGQIDVRTATRKAG